MNWEIFINVSSGVLGFLVPVIAIIIVAILVIIAASIPHLLEIHAINAKLQPPFDDVEFETNPLNRTLNARFIKKGETVWQGNISRKMLEK